MGELRPDARRGPPDWRVVRPANPTSFGAVVDRPILRAHVLKACRVSMPREGQGYDRTRLVSVSASSESGKTFLLGDVARHADVHFVKCGFDSQLASWAWSVVVFAINFSSHFSVSNLEVKLIKMGKFKLKHLSALRLVFLELANLSSACSVLQKLLVAVKTNSRGWALHSTADRTRSSISPAVSRRSGR